MTDGNGRIQRLLLHHVLARRGFGPQGIILPVSAVILNRPREYDQALESFSTPLMERVEYTMDDRQRMTITNDTADFYRYIDCTELTRITIDFIRETIEAVMRDGTGKPPAPAVGVVEPGLDESRPRRQVR